MKATGTKAVRNRGLIIVCGRRRAAFAKCDSGRCYNRPLFLCDFVVARDPVRTCDEPICELHAQQVGEGRHHCRRHADANPKLEL